MIAKNDDEYIWDVSTDCTALPFVVAQSTQSSPVHIAI